MKLTHKHNPFFRAIAACLLVGWLVFTATGAIFPAMADDSHTRNESALQDEDSKPQMQEAVQLSELGQSWQTTSVAQRFLSFVGLGVMLLIAWLISANRRAVPWRVIAWGLGLQLVFAIFILKTAIGKTIFAWMNSAVLTLLSFTNVGAEFIFGDYLTMTFSFALNVLPTIVFFSALMTVLYHLGIMQVVVKAFGWVMQKTMGTSASESLSSAANIFVGQTEAPLVVKPFVSTMTRSELMAVMSGV